MGISHIFKAEEDLVEQRFNSIEKGLARALLLLAEHGKEPDLETKILSITARSSGNALGGIHLAT